MLLKLTKNKILSGIIIFGLITNLLVLFDIQYFYLRAIFSFIFLITIPGLLIMLMLEIREIGFWEYLVYTIGASIAFLMFGGLFINWTLPLVGIDKPLSLGPLFVSFNIFLLIFWLIVFKRNKEITLKIKLPKLSWLNKVFLVIPVIFIFLSIFGATMLNNNGPNTLTMIMLIGIAVYIFMVVLYRNKLNKNIYPFSILMISISLLLAVSLRSRYISGWDIFQEYYLFQLTKEGFNWSVSSFSDAYSVCLSITILPTVLSSFLKINDHYVFKLLFQLIFSFVPVGVFLFLRTFAQDILAFIASFFFISQSDFFESCPKVIRREIALLFFTLTLLVLFNKNINSTLKKILFLVFGFSIIVSHYTTFYVALALFIFTYLLCLIFRKTENRKPFFKIYEKFRLKEKGSRSNERKYYLSGILILLLIVFAFFWYAQSTEIYSNLVDLTHEAIQNMEKIFSVEMRVSFNSLWNPFYKQVDKASLLQDYAKDISSEYKNLSYVSLYLPEKYGDYSPNIIELGNMPSKINIGIVSKIYIFAKIINRIMGVFIIIGTLYLLFFQLKKRKMDVEYIFLCLVGLFSLMPMIILANITIIYGFTKVYQQTLIFLSLLAVIGGSLIFKFVMEKYGIVLVLIIFLFCYLFFSGIIPQIVGGTDASLLLNNYGGSYDAHYTHKTEVMSSNWLMSNWDNKSLVYAERLAAWRLLTFGKFILVLTDVLPSTIDRNAYIYLRYSNVVKNLNSKSYKGQALLFNYPTEFLNQNKNLIYSNGGSNIFK